ncbi:tyrosine-type recombinase/integrase [Microbispora bryophytorum]|uniref:tyrosine-type recombinase/integrase n=1 Tax=Microbispora bryophytorum TaxID=1460882 RepID=UPI00340836FE
MAADLLKDLAASFTRDLRAADKADRTIVLYNQSIRFFCDWLQEHGLPETTESLTKRQIASWLADLREKQAATTVLTRFRGMRRFTKWLIAEGEIDDDPMANLEKPSPSSKPVPLMVDEEISKLLKVCDGRTFEGRRDEAIFRVLFDCGLRIAELAKLGVDDVDLDNEVVHVIGKGRRPRVVPFSAKTARALDRYGRLRRKHRHSESSGWWLGQRGALSADGIDHILRVRAQQAGVKNVHAHRFRHTFAHDWLVNGGQERDLMRLAGWRTDTMLGVYGASAATERAHLAARRMKRGDRL